MVLILSNFISINFGHNLRDKLKNKKNIANISFWMTWGTNGLINFFYYL